TNCFLSSSFTPSRLRAHESKDIAMPMSLPVIYIWTSIYYLIGYLFCHLTLLLQASPLAAATLRASENVTRTNTSCTRYPPSISVVHVDILGDVHSATTYVKRDLGFQGQMGPYVLLSYGDTLYSDPSYSDTWRGMTSDSIAFATQDPLVVVDPVLNSDGYPPQFCPLISSFGEDPSECALGINNVVP